MWMEHKSQPDDIGEAALFVCGLRVGMCVWGGCNVCMYARVCDGLVLSHI